MGMAWSFFNPILMLSIYTFVFSGVFKGRWGFSLNEGRTEYALILCSGVIVAVAFKQVNNAPHGKTGTDKTDNGCEYSLSCADKR